MRVRFLKFMIKEIDGKKHYLLSAQADVSESGGAWGGGNEVAISRKTAQALLGPSFPVKDCGGFWAGVTITIY